ncbi:MAG: hypothetical protein P4L35_07850 [Ignavibacteriaceae bacterium]|nr:hypothetical protein [Ignavibacteriaceae bacterium]
MEWFEGNFCSPNCANDFKIAKVNEAKQRIENTGKIRKAEQEFVSALENFYNIKRTNQPSEYSKSFGSYIIDALKKSKCKGDLYFDIVNKYYGECYSCNRCEGCKNKRKNLLDSIE